jgi:MFS family permease
MLPTRQVHYAWVIVAIAAAMGFITSAVRFAAAALVPHLSDPTAGFGWSYGAISLAFSLQWIVLGLVSPYVGWLGDRYGVRWLLLLGALLFIAGMMLTGVMSNLWQFYLFFGVVLGVATTIYTVLTVSSVTLWFRRHLGVAMGVVWSFQGAGTIALLFLIGAAFTQLGMKWIFWLPGIAGGAILLLLVRFFHDGPAEIGLRPLGDVGSEPVQKPLRDEATKERARVFIQQAKRTFTFWNLIGIHYWGCMGHNIINVLVVAIAVDRGLSLGLAAGVLATQQAVGVFARGAMPVIAEHLGCRMVWIVGMSLQVFPLLIILFIHDPWAFYLFAVLFAFGQSSEVPTFPIANRQYYGNVPQSGLYGWQNVGNGLGMGMAPVCAGILWDVTGTYAAPLIMSLGFSTLALISAWFLPSPRTRLIPDWESHLPASLRTTG